eukprot:scaffold4809_cov116-Isochrysis_galbana.AAC.2
MRVPIATCKQAMAAWVGRATAAAERLAEKRGNSKGLVDGWSAVGGMSLFASGRRQTAGRYGACQDPPAGRAVR